MEHVLNTFPARNDNITRTFICNGVASSHICGPVTNTVSKHSLHKASTSVSGAALSSSSAKKYVLVDESQLSHLTEFERKHRKEVSHLAEHGLISELSSAAILPTVCDERIPTPAARKMVYDFCEAEMRAISAEIGELNKSWTKHSKDNHYNKPHLFQRDSYVSRAPLQHKAMKLRLVNHAVRTWLTNKERDTMSFEDDMSRLVGRYVEAQIRRRDYDRYYVLATRFGIWSVQEYYKQPRPGKRYWKLVTDAALKFQKAWTVYWALTRLKRFRSARQIQTSWRRSYHFRRLNPLIKLRVRCGKRSVMKFFWTKWLEYNSLCRKIKDALLFQLASWRDKCFHAWRDYFKSKKDRKEQVIKRFVLRMKNIELVGCFLRWTAFTLRRKRGKLFLRRLFQCPHFDTWHQYALQSKRQKRRSKAALVLQAFGRMRIQRRRFVEMKSAARVLDRFMVYALAHFVVKLRRRQCINTEFEDWGPEELRRRDRAEAEIERRRRLQQQQIIKDKERKAVSELRRHWKTRDGKIQLKELAKSLRQPNTTRMMSLLTQSAELDSVKRLMLRHCRHLVVVREIHEFNVKRPPYIQCMHPMCGQVFTSDDLYRSHRLSSSVHSAVNADSQLDEYYVAAAIPEEEGTGAAAILDSSAIGQFPDSQSEDKYSSDNLVGALVSGESILPPLLDEDIAVDNNSNNDNHMVGEHSQLLEELRCSRQREWAADDAKLPFTELHIQLRNQLGIDLLRGYLIRSRGIDSAVNCLDLWVAIEDWRKKSVYSDHYKSRALNILDTYLCDDCSRPLQLLPENIHEGPTAQPLQMLPWSWNWLLTNSQSPGPVSQAPKKRFKKSSAAGAARPVDEVNSSSYLHELRKRFDTSDNVNTSLFTIVDRLTSIKESLLGRKDEEMFVSARASLSLWRKLVGLSGQPFKKWTDQKMIPADIFDQLQWLCFAKLHHAVASDEAYFSSPEYHRYDAIVRNDAEVRRLALLEDYKSYRTSEILAWARGFRCRELEILALALKTANHALEDEVEQLVLAAMRLGADEIVAVVRNEEQIRHEHLAAVLDEALDWVCIDVMEAVYEFYVSSMLEAMWCKTELRKGMLQYSGLLKGTRGGALLRSVLGPQSLDSKDGRGVNAKNILKDEDWFPAFFAQALAEERALIPIEASIAATRIQARWRGVCGRRIARKSFVATFYKR